MAYHLAWLLVAEIDARLRAGWHFRDRAGRCLLHLDEVVRAILDNRLIWPGGDDGAT